MTRDKKSLQEQIVEADFLMNKYMGDFNEMDEAGKGQTARAQALYAKCQRWLDRYNKLVGDGE